MKHVFEFNKINDFKCLELEFLEVRELRLKYYKIKN